jgi:regulator of sirC expression with transglutaminase-like and TPR domain
VSPDAGRFARLAVASEGTVRLAEAALWVAAEEYPELDIAAWLRRLDALGECARRRVAPEATADDAAAALGILLAKEHGLRGNAADYYDPRNSFLNDVLERRLGIPITLSVIYIDVAARAGVSVRGVGLPGHFIVRLTRQGAVRLLDPFHGGGVIGEADCHALVRQMRGPDAPFDEAWLRPVTTPEIVARMLANLKAIYARRGDWPHALRTVECLVALRPEAPGEVRDRGTIHGKLGDARAAIRDWERYLRTAPEAADADDVRQRLRALRQSLGVLN